MLTCNQVQEEGNWLSLGEEWRQKQQRVSAFSVPIIHTYLYNVYIYIYVCVYIYTCAYIYIHITNRTYIYIRIYIYNESNIYIMYIYIIHYIYTVCVCTKKIHLYYHIMSHTCFYSLCSNLRWPRRASQPTAAVQPVALQAKEWATAKQLRH